VGASDRNPWLGDTAITNEWGNVGPDEVRARRRQLRAVVRCRGAAVWSLRWSKVRNRP
jgi:hypothetical protein